MLRNYFRVVFRNYFKKGGNLLFTIINLTGLIIGLAAFLIIAHLVRYELSYDKSFTGAENIYRIKVEKVEHGEVVMQSAKSYPGVGPLLKAAIPEVKDYTRILAEECMLHYRENDTKFNRQKVFWADETFPSVFGLTFVESGNLASLREPYTSIISKTAAERYFGKDWSGEKNPIGKTIWLNEGLAFTVVGVFNDIPANSHMAVDFVVSYETLVVLVGKFLDDGMPPVHNVDYTYIALQPGADVLKVEKLAQKVLEEKIPASAAADINYVFAFQPLTSIHLHSHLTDELSANGNKIFVIALSLSAVLILVVALINFVNLTTARAMDRAKEVGVRKAIGSTRTQLVAQFIFEAAFSCVIAAVGASVLAFFVSGYFETLVGIPVRIFSAAHDGGYSWILFFVILLMGGLIASVYPAAVLSSFKPIDVLKGKVATHSATGKGYLRKGLIAFQFFFAVFLLSATGAIYYQLDYMQKQSLGMDPDQVLVLHSPRSKIGSAKRMAIFEGLRDKLKTYPEVVSVGAAGCLPGHSFLNHTDGVRQQGSDEGKNISFDVADVEEGYLPSLDIRLLAGRNFVREDRQKGVVLINATASDALGFASAEDAVGKPLLVGEKQYEIAGVMDDAHYEGLQKHVRPLLLHYGHNYEFGFFTIKMNTSDIRNTLAIVQRHWKETYPSDPFDYFFMNAFFDQQYRSDRIFGKVFGIFSSLAIIIACLGLIGLVSFTTFRKTKEIGIRKVLGANSAQILSLLTGEFFKPILVACVIAVPLTHYVVSRWLDTFAHRFDLAWWMHLLPLPAIMLLAFFTISWQAMKAAMANPVHALKDE